MNLTFSGAPAWLGRQHGEALRDAIAETYRWYADPWWSMTARELQEFVRDHARAVTAHARRLADEVARAPNR